MARKKSRESRPRVRRTDAEMSMAVQAHLTTLEILARAYDDGHTAAAGAMATAILNIVETRSRDVVQARGQMVFPSPEGEMTADNMIAANRCVGMSMQAGPEGHFVSFVPWFLLGSDKPTMKPFRVWWSTEPIYVEGIGGPSPDGMIPLLAADQLAWDDRAKLTRQQFITDLRNSVGSHPDQEIPALLHDLYQASSFGGTPAAMMPDGSIGTIENGAIVQRVGPAEATARQIAEEVLMAYGRKSVFAWTATTLPPES